jgi:Zn-dependent protease with chaperone function/Zn-finger nucleic acid-binding protein
MAIKPAPDFYEVQRQQRRKSLFVFFILILFYFFAVGFLSGILLLFFGIFLSKGGWLAGSFLVKLLLLNAALSFIIASFHYYDAKKFGARFILKRLMARPPDRSDRYHKQFVNSVDGIRIASGLPRVIPRIIPQSAINALAMVSADGTPNIIATEGLLSELTRDELEAVVSHEVAHIIRGDAFYITLVCSLANLFERLRLALEPGDHAQRSGVASIAAYLVVSLSAITMRLLSMLISREREILADAAAVELCRNPKALARALYKTHLKNSFVGDFSLTYSPLFIIPPKLMGKSEGFLSRLFNSHPPVMKRIRLLADMAKTKPHKIIEEVYEIQKRRKEAQILLPSREEVVQETDSAAAKKDKVIPLEGKVWSIRDPQGNWQGPYALNELLFIRFFTPMIQVKNLQEGVEARAREFVQIRDALSKLGKKKPLDARKQNRCPRCHVFLREDYYEGTPLKICPQCSGKLVDSSFKWRILSRKEVTFSENLIKKAHDFKEQFLDNPFYIRKIREQKSKRISCPDCGSRMLARPFSYQYVIPVDKCFYCYKIWFDADELEILQILTEKS